MSDTNEEVKEVNEKEGEAAKDGDEEKAADEGDNGDGADEGEVGDEADEGDQEAEGAEEDEGAEEEEEEEAEEDTEEMRKASLEKAADKGFELRKRGEDKWNLKIRLYGFKLAVTDEYMEFYCTWLKERLDKEKEEYGDEFLENARAEVDFSQTGLENSAAKLLLKALVDCKVRVWILKLFKNRLSKEGMEALCDFLTGSETFNTVQEVHLTHNKFDNDSVLLLLRTLNKSEFYPPKKGEDDDSDAKFPIWIRLDKNKVEEPEALLETAKEEGILTCTDGDRKSWGTTKFSEGECPVAHLYGFMNQGFDGENPVGGPRAKGKGKEKRSSKGKGSGSKGDGKKSKGEGKGKTKDRAESKGESKGKGKSKERGAGKEGSGGGGYRGKGGRAKGGGGRDWDDWSGGWGGGNWGANKGRQGGYGGKGYRNDDWDDYGRRDYGSYGGNWYDRGGDNWYSDYGRSNRGWDDMPSKGYGGKGFDRDYKGGKGGPMDSYRGKEGPPMRNRGWEEPRGKDGPPLRNRGWEEPRPPPRSKAEAWLG